MSLQTQIDQEIALSMKEGTATLTGVLRLIKNALKNEQIKLRRELGEAEELKIVQREAKQRKDSIMQYEEAGRTDLADVEKAELLVIQKYLPSQMSDSELSTLVDQVIADVSADKTQMGVVIGQVMKLAEGKADGGAVSAMVRQKLV